MPTGEEYEADIHVDENLGDLLKEFYESIGEEVDINYVKVRLEDHLLDLDLTVQKLGIQNDDKLLLVYDIFHMDFVKKNTLQGMVPFPENLQVTEYLHYSNDFLSAVNSIYSIFSVFISDDIEASSALRKMLEGDPKIFLEQGKMYRIFKGGDYQPLQLTKIHYGSPFVFDISGLWKPLEMLRDIVKDIDWRAAHEKEMARLERKKTHLEVAEQCINLIEKASKLKIPNESKAELKSILLYEVSKIDSVIIFSNSQKKKNTSRLSRPKNNKYHHG